MLSSHNSHHNIGCLSWCSSSRYGSTYYTSLVQVFQAPIIESLLVAPSSPHRCQPALTPPAPYTWHQIVPSKARKQTSRSIREQFGLAVLLCGPHIWVAVRWIWDCGAQVQRVAEDPTQVPGVPVELWRMHPWSSWTLLAWQIEGVRFFNEDAAFAKMEWLDVGLIYMTDLLWDDKLSQYCLLYPESPNRKLSLCEVSMLPWIHKSMLCCKRQICSANMTHKLVVFTVTIIRFSEHALM